MRREHEFRGVGRAIDCLRRAGLSDARAARHHRAFGDFVLGYGALDAEFAALDPDTRAADLRSPVPRLGRSRAPAPGRDMIAARSPGG